MPTVTQSAADSRLHSLVQWLQEDLALPVQKVEPASADASFRRYFRVLIDGDSRIAMDAPPDREDSAPFVRVARALESVGVPVPAILAMDLDRGFLLLSDLGSTHLLGALRAGAVVDEAYAPAAAALLRMQCAGRVVATELPLYDEALLAREMALFPDWFLQRHLGVTPDAGTDSLLQDVATVLIQSALSQPQVFVHRDYHSRNLMVTQDGGIGVIDFQDAVFGPVTYDLVSLYKDCYIAWPRDDVLRWVEAHRQALCRNGFEVGDPAQFLRWFDFMGLQRHLKVLGIFARLWYRDGKNGYLADLPLVLRYVLEVTSAYPELTAFDEFLRDEVGPRFNSAQQREGVL